MDLENLAVYHWSPLERRHDILDNGLRPFSRSLSCVGDGEYEDATLGYVCLGLTPRRAWDLSGDTNWGREQDGWDLWQVRLSSSDDIRARVEDAYLEELRVHNVIPPDRVWWVGEREPWLTDPDPKPKKN